MLLWCVYSPKRAPSIEDVNRPTHSHGFHTGENCHDTKAFVNATYLGGFQTLLRGCKAQLRDTDLDFSSIDYGFGWKTSFALAYAVMSRAQKAGTIIGFILLGLLGGAVLTITLLIVRLSCRRRIRYRPKESYEFASRFGYA